MNTVRKYKELPSLYEEANKITGARVELVLKQLGISFEKQKQYKKAISVYEKALPLTVDPEDLDELMIAIDRCDMKMEV